MNNKTYLTNKFKYTCISWKDMVKKEIRKIGLDERDAQDRMKWRTGIATWKE